MKVHFTENVDFVLKRAPPEKYQLVLDSPALSAGIYTLSLNLLDAFPGGGTYQDVLLAQREVKVLVNDEAADTVLITALGAAAHQLRLPGDVEGAMTHASDPSPVRDPHAIAEAWGGCVQVKQGIASRMLLHLSRAPPESADIFHSWSLSPAPLHTPRDEDPPPHSLVLEQMSPVRARVRAGAETESEGQRNVLDFDSPVLAAGEYLLRVQVHDDREKVW